MIRNVRFENSFHVAVHGMSEFKHSILVQRRMESFRFLPRTLNDVLREGSALSSLAISRIK